MSRTVDERVVIMQFDNKQFESGIAQSTKSLDEFDKKLQFKNATKGIDSISKSLKDVDFSSIQSNLETISNRFSTFGIAGMAVISRLTNAAIDFAKNGLGKIINQINEGGKRRAKNIEGAHFLLQGLLGDEEKVQDVMGRAMESVEGTAFGFDSAAKAASNFVASGIEAEKLNTFLKATANLASATGANYEGVSDIMGKIAGQGRIMGNELQQFSSMGINAAQYIAEYLTDVNKGKIKVDKALRDEIKQSGLLKKNLEVSQKMVRDAITDKKTNILPDVVVEGLNNKLKDIAKRANETFTGATENVKASMSRIGAMFYTPLIEQNSKLIQMINSVRIVLNEAKKGIEPFAKTVTSLILTISGGISKIADLEMERPILRLSEAFTGLNDILSPISSLVTYFVEQWQSVFGDSWIDNLNEAILSFASFANTFKITSEEGLALRTSVSMMLVAIKHLLVPFQDFAKLSRTAFKDVFGGGEFNKNLINIIDSITVLIKKFDLMADYSTALDSFKTIFASIKTIFGSIWKVVKAIGSSLVETFAPEGANTFVNLFAFIAKILSNIANLVEINEERFKNLKDTFSGIFGVVKKVLTIFVNIFGKVTELFPAIGELVSAVLDLIGGFARLTNAGDKTGNSVSFIENVVGFLVDVLKSLTTGLASAIRALKEFLKPIIDTIKESGILQNVIGLIGDVFKTVFNIIKDAGSKIKEVFSSMRPEGVEPKKLMSFADVLKKVNDWITKLRDTLKNFKIGDGLASFVETIKSLFNSNKKSKGLGAATGGGLGQMAKLSTTISDVSKSIPSEKDTTKLKDWLNVLGPLFKLIATVVGGAIIFSLIKKVKKGLESFKKFGDYFKEFGNEAKKGVKNWAEFPKDIVNTWNSGNTKAFIVALIGVLSFLVLAIAVLIKVISDIKDPSSFLTVFVSAMGAAVVLIAIIMGSIIAITKTLEKSSLDARTFNQTLKQISGIIFVLSLMILAIGASIYLMTKNINDAAMFENVGITFVIIIAVLGILIAALIKTAQQSPKALESVKKLTSVLLAIAAILLVTGYVIGKIAEAIKADPTGKAIMAMVAILAVLGLLIASIVILGAKYGGSLGNVMKLVPLIISIGVVMSMFSIALRGLVITLKLLDMVVNSSSDIGNTLKVFGLIVAGMVVAIGLLGALTFALQGSGGGGGSLLAISASLIVLSTAMIVMAGAFAAFNAAIEKSTDAWKTIGIMGAALGGMVVALAALIIVAKVAGASAPILLSIGAALIMIAGAVAIFGLAINSISEGIIKFFTMMETVSSKGPETIEKFGESIIKFVEIIPKYADKIANMLGTLINKLWDKFRENIKNRIKSAGETFGEIVDIMYDALTKNKKKLKKITKEINNIISSLAENFDIGSLLFGKNSGFDAQAEGIFGIIKEIIIRLATFLPETIFNIITNIMTLISDNSEMIKNFLIDRVHDLGEVFGEILIVGAEAIQGAAGTIIDTVYFILGGIVDGLANWLASHQESILSVLGAPIAWLAELLIRNKENILVALAAPIEWLAELLIREHDNILTVLGGITIIFLEWLGKIIQALPKWWSDNWPAISEFAYNSFMDVLNLALKALLDSTERITAAAIGLGLKVITGFMNGISENVGELADSAIKMVETIRDEVVTEDNVQKIMDAGAGIIKNFLNGMSEWLEDKNNIREIRDAIDRFGNAIINAIKTFFGWDDSGNLSKDGAMYKTTGNFLQGFANGIQRAWENNPVSKAIKWFTDKVKGETNKGLEEESPSKFTEKSAKYFVQGFANGVEKNGKIAINSITEVTDDIKNTFSLLMGALEVATLEEFDINPVITPVVDVSNIESAAEMASNAFSGSSGGFAVTYGAASALASNFAQNGGVGSNTSTNNSSVVNFTQNNYSPKSLSHYELYRQTKNLLHTIEETK